MALPPNSANQRTRDEQASPNRFKSFRQTTVVSKIETGWDIANKIVHSVIKMAAGGFSVEEQSHDGHKSVIQHGDSHEAVAGRTADTAGHHDERSQGGHRNQNNSEHHETGGDSTKAGDGNRIKASNSSDKLYSKGGDGHMHHSGDMTFSVEEGGLHYNVAKEFTVTSTGKLIHFDSAGDTSITTSKRTTVISQSDINIISLSSITLRVGESYILITPSSIQIMAQGGSGRIDINK